MSSVYADTLPILKELGVDPTKGLTSQQIQEHRQKFGSNVIDLPAPEPWWKNLIEKFKENPIPILIGAAAISIVLALIQGHFPVDGLAILVAVFLATGVGFINEYKSGIEYEKLKLSRLDVPVTVTREGREHKISVSDVVVGDIVHLQTGSKIPGDSRLIHGDEMAVDQSRFNGEAVPASKGADDVALWGGTDVVQGTGVAVVIKVGNESEWGKIAKVMVAEEQEKTPLEERLDKLTEMINKVGTWTAILIFAALTIELVVRGLILREPLSTEAGDVFVLGLNAATFDQIVRFVIVAVTIVVVAVPEGLPMAVNVSLAFSMKKITQDKNLVRKLMACETIGAANVICSDKTGTLTENRMTVMQVHLDETRLTGTDVNRMNAHRLFDLLRLSAAVNSTAHLIPKDGRMVPDGNSTEGALLQWIAAHEVDYRQLRESCEIVKRVPFSSQTKIMTSVIRVDSQLLVLTKGAPDRVLSHCAAVETSTGVRPVAAYTPVLHEELDYMTSQAMRVLALAYKWLPDQDVSKVDINSDLTLLALIGISDPMRQDVPHAIVEARNAGIDVKMITGDDPKTARVLAEELGLLDSDAIVMEGHEFRALPDEDVIGILPHLRVLARAEPLDKLRLVNLLQDQRQVVAMTGDGTNDAPALKKADVGLSMGLSGTEVAKEASDIVLLDDNFKSIVRAVHWGRALYENIQKFIQFQLTINVSALATAFLSPLLNIFLVPLFGIRLLEVPLTVTQLLWVNLIMDTLAVLALCLEPPAPDTMKRPPVGRTVPFITRTMWENILGMGAYFTVVLLILQATNFLGADKSQVREFPAVIFTTYVFFQVFNEFNCRSLNPMRSAFDGLWASRNFLAVVALIVIVQVLLTQFGGAVFNTAPLPVDLWAKILLLTSTALIFGEGVRFIRRSRMKAEAKA